jgi:SLT domain-containing protein
MKQNGIPGTYNGIYRNIMRESSGNPNAINNWDSNAAAGTPSRGLLQTIQPTFDAYHVAGTSTNIYDPVANIVAACNYAYHVYGSIDNVNGPY